MIVKNIGTLICIAMLFFPFLSFGQKDVIAECESYNYGAVPDTSKYYFPVAQYITIYAASDVKSKVLYKTTSYSDTLRVIKVLTDKFSRYKNIYG